VQESYSSPQARQEESQKVQILLAKSGQNPEGQDPKQDPK
jgi:hypothetical protein